MRCSGTRPSAIVLLGVVLLLVPAARAEEFYVDPATGDPGNDGSAAHPWRTLQEVIADDLVETRTWDALPYTASSTLVPRNVGAPVKAGDTIWLRSGYHGELDLLRMYNSALVTIAAEPGHSPQLRRARIVASANWLLRGVSISPSHDASYTTVHLVEVTSHNYSGPAHDVVIEGCELFSVRDTSAWTIDDWNNLACNGISLSGDDCVARDNHLLNVNFGITVSGARGLVEGNVIENFAGDGLRGLGDHGTFQYNTVKNCYDVNANHDDGFQSWSVGPGGVGTGEVVGITLRGNTIINYTDPDQPFRGTLQGIGCFDGFFVDWVIENNVILTDHWHGITLLGARNSRIVNNTVLDLNDTTPGPPWISIGLHKDGTASTGCVVRNNLTTALSIAAGQDVTEDHNALISDVDAYFVNYLGGDLHLIPSSPARNVGSSVLAPVDDRDRVPRPQEGVEDLGAYEYLPPGTDAGPLRDATSNLDAQAVEDAGLSGDAGTDAGTVADSGALSDAATAADVARVDSAPLADASPAGDAAMAGDAQVVGDASPLDTARADLLAADQAMGADVAAVDGSREDAASVVEGGAIADAPVTTDSQKLSTVVARGCSCREGFPSAPSGLLALALAGLRRRPRSERPEAGA